METALECSPRAPTPAAPSPHAPPRPATAPAAPAAPAQPAGDVLCTVCAVRIPDCVPCLAHPRLSPALAVACCGVCHDALEEEDGDDACAWSPTASEATYDGISGDARDHRGGEAYLADARPIKRKRGAGGRRASGAVGASGFEARRAEELSADRFGLRAHGAARAAPADGGGEAWTRVERKAGVFALLHEPARDRAARTVDLAEDTDYGSAAPRTPANFLTLGAASNKRIVSVGGVGAGAAELRAEAAVVRASADHDAAVAGGDGVAEAHVALEAARALRGRAQFESRRRPAAAPQRPRRQRGARVRRRRARGPADVRAYVVAATADPATGSSVPAAALRVATGDAADRASTGASDDPIVDDEDLVAAGLADAPRKKRALAAELGDDELCENAVDARRRARASSGAASTARASSGPRRRRRRCRPGRRRLRRPRRRRRRRLNDAPGGVVVPKYLGYRQEHQVEAARFLYDQTVESLDLPRTRTRAFGCVLAHSMGLGKALTCIAYMAALLKDPAARRRVRTCLVVCPTNVVRNWAAEFRKCVDALEAWQRLGGVCVVGYDFFHALVGKRGEKKRKRKKKMDLAALLGPASSERRRLSVDGRAVEADLNRDGSIQWEGERFASASAFAKRVLKVDKVNGHAKVTYKAVAPKKDVTRMKKRMFVLQDLIKDFVLRRDESLLAKEMGKTEYLAALRERDGAGAAAGGGRRRVVLARRRRRRAASGAPAARTTAQTLLLFELLSECLKRGDKMVVFTQSLATLDFLEHALASETWGGLLDPNRDRIQDALDHGGAVRGGWRPRVDFFRIEGSAGNMGINLVAANRVVLFDACWNPAIDRQALFRCFRYGQTKHVYIYRLVAQGFERRVYQRANQKEFLALKVVDDAALERLYDFADLGDVAPRRRRRRRRAPRCGSIGRLVAAGAASARARAPRRADVHGARARAVVRGAGRLATSAPAPVSAPSAAPAPVSAPSAAPGLGGGGDARGES
ncbi:transcriptional regulator ATRX [Aureococcus anophagefferens]|nr:transcriptional regulator ATRX [Aureococcus anophagefferens]